MENFVSNHNVIIRDAAKAVLSPYGIFQKEQSRVWIDDNGWFLTIIEFQPSGWSRGSYLNVGILFLWREHESISFDFSVDNGIRVFIDNRQLFIEYKDDDVEFKERAINLAQIALEKALPYRQFRNIKYARKYILERKYSSTWAAYNKLMFCLLTNDKKKKIFLVKHNNFYNRIRSDDFRQRYEKHMKDIDNYLKSDDTSDEIISNIQKHRDSLQSKSLKLLSCDIKEFLL